LTRRRRAGLRERLSYRFDRFMERGTVALIAGLFVVSLAIILGVVLVMVLVRGDDGIDPLQLIWMATMRTLDAGTMGGDEGSAGFLFGMLAVTLGGIFVISTLIGILSNGLQDRLAALRKGRSRVLEQDHVLILGWSQQVFAVISELIEAGAGRRRTAIVVLADRDRVEMESAIRERVTLPRRVRVVCRSGRSTSLTDLRIANPDEARAIVVLQPEGDDPDVDVLKTILALTGRPDRRPEPYRIVAEVRDQASVSIARLIAGDQVHLLLADDLISRIIAQTCRQSGLSAVYLDLLDFAGHEFHVADLPELSGLTFGDAVARVAGGIPAGIVRDGRAHLCPPPSEVVRQGDLLVVLAEDHGTARLGAGPAAVEHDALVAAVPRGAPPERTLILGWNRRGTAIISELDEYVSPGSEVIAVSPLPRVVVEVGEIAGLRNLRAEGRLGNTTSRAVLDDLGVASYNHVIVLCESDDREPEMADARTLLTLLHLRDIGAAAGRTFSIVSEMLDERDRELAEVARADDFIVSARVLSLLLAQIAETPELADVFRDLFDADGAEVYLRDVADYVAPGREIGFATLQAAAQARGEVALGYRILARANEKAAGYGVVLNPGRDARVAFSRGDRVVVLAER
jgi:ion channel POLLUX/CASTOR